MVDHNRGAVPDISFIIPAYNAEKTIKAAANSVLRQCGATFELIIVDDGSVDATLSVIDRLAENNEGVTTISQPNGGTGAALNRGRQAARGGLIAHVDADDELTDDYLATMWKFISAEPDYDMYSHDLWRVGIDGSRRRVFGLTEARTTTLDQFLIQSYVNGPGTLLRREIVERVGGYREGVYNEDYDFWLRALAAGARIIYYPEPLYLYHETPGQKTEDRAQVYRSIIEVLENLIASYDLSQDQTATVHASLEHYQSGLEDLERYGVVLDDVVGQRFMSDAVALRTWLERHLPESMVDGAQTAIHKVTWIIRPIRPIWWKTKVRMNSVFKKR